MTASTQEPGWIGRVTDAAGLRRAGPPTDAEGWSPEPAGRWCGRCGATGPGRSLAEGGCAFCKTEPIAWDGVLRLGEYAEPLSAWIKAMKYGRQWSIAPWLGGLLGERVGEAFGLAAGRIASADACVVVHVPMHWTRRWRRGFDQSSLIARGLADAAGLAHEPLLRRARRTAPQTAVPRSKRPANVRDAFAIAPVDLQGRAVILVDDVKTSGATASRCARLLKRHRAGRVCLAVAAVGDPRGQGFTAV